MTAVLAGALALGGAACRKDSPRPIAPRSESSAANIAQALPVLWQAPPWAFPDQNGRPTTAADLHGHIWIADFIFTQCTTVCPLITAKMALLQRRLRGPDLRFVSFSVDPAHDTPEALKRYAAEWRPGESRWTLLATAPVELEALASAMHISVNPAGQDINHTQLFFLVDAGGDVRGIYESEKDDAVERLVRDTEALSGAAAATAAAGSPRDEATTGAALYAALGCGACHARRDLAPAVEGLMGRRVLLEGGAELTADAAYVRESIVAPAAKLVAGYATRMPSYDRELTPRQLAALVEHVTALATTSRAAATAAAEPGEATAGSATDPVCSMKVRVVATTPHATHAERTYHFCSDRCRDRFVAEPARYLKLARR